MDTLDNAREEQHGADAAQRAAHKPTHLFDGSSEVCHGAIAGVVLDGRHMNRELTTRGAILQEKAALDEARTEAFKQTKGLSPGCAEKNELYGRIQRCVDQSSYLESLLETRLLPQHGLQQIVSPAAFLQSPLFRVGSKNCSRIPQVRLVLLAVEGKPVIQYRGPELRQSDALVFSALLHMARDVPPGLFINFPPGEACKVLFGRYDGNARNQLREHIQRLQSGVVQFESYSVQMCLRFEYPARGPWAVALDAGIVEVFRRSKEVWLDLPTRLALPEGLATWLYGYVRSQSWLKPTKLEWLRARCGSTATPRAFMNSLRVALGQLTARGLLEPGWSLGAGELRWMKKRNAHTK